MKLLKLVRMTVVVSALGLGACATRAQDTNIIQQPKLQLEQMQSNFDRVVREQREQIDSLTKRLDDLTKQQAAEAEKKKLEAQIASELATNQPVPLAAGASTASTEAAAKSWSPTDPIRIGKGSAYADLGLVATFAAGGSTANDIEGGTQLGGHDPNQRGFTVQGVELNLQGAVDPYFRGNANLAFLIDSGGETGVELEEAWLETVSLPWNLQLRAGQILTEFGRINTQHPHSWAFVDVPLVSARFFGEDGLRNPGMRLSWLVPTPFYSELFLSVQDSQGDTAHSFRQNTDPQTITNTLPSGRTVVTTYDNRVKSVTDLLFTPRYAVSFDLSDSQTLVAGVSAAFGPNSMGNDADTRIYGADLYWKWKPANAHGGFPFVSWQTEAMLREYEYVFQDFAPSGRPFVAKGTDESWGFYSQLAWGFTKGWVVGLRGEYVSRTGSWAPIELTLPGGRQVSVADPAFGSRWRISPNLTWYPSEFSKIRLQYNCDDRDEIGVDHSVWLQFEFLLGAHAAHKF